jgi:serine/threonine protein kinase
MSVESRRVQTDAWTQWESQVVNGVYPLRRFLGGSNHSAVFLTEYRAENIANAAIKFVPADTLQAQAQLVQWGTAITLSHRHLVRLFDVGRCRFAGREFLFVVMEYADQTLAELLPRRALSPDEARDLLTPTLDALAFLHRNGLVHGHLKPSNFLVVDDKLKLASDTISSAIKPTTGTVRDALHDPPELKEGARSPAGDVWDLGITLVEALTQRTPIWPDERAETALLPVKLPPPFVDIVRRCLSRPAANRPTALELQAQYKPTPWAALSAGLDPSEIEACADEDPEQRSRLARVLIPALSAIAAIAVITVGVWVSFHLIQQKRPRIRLFASGDSQEYLQQEVVQEVPPAPDNATPATAAVPTTEPLPVAEPPPVAATQTLPPAPASPTAAASMAAPPGPILVPTDDANGVLHEELPEVTRPIIERIHGHVRVAVRVLVDPAGNVVGEFMENAGPSTYFARLAGEAADKWKFAPTDGRGARVWVLRFEFTRDGATVDVNRT